MNRKDLDKIDEIERSFSIFFKVLLVIILLLSIIELNIFLIFMSIIVLLVAFIPSFIEKKYEVCLPIEFDFILTLFLWMHYGLGSYNEFYLLYPWWDVMLHSFSGLLLGTLGFVIAYTLLFTKKVKAAPFFISIFSITFAISIGALWEIIEFAADNIWGLNTQESGLVDTMWDLILDSTGAIIVGTMGYFYMKNPKKGFIDRLINKMVLFNKEKWHTKVLKFLKIK